MTWSARQCRDYLQYKRLDTDGAMPKNVGPLRIRCLEVMGRASPTVSPHPSDDEASVSDEREETDEGGEPNLVLAAPNTSHDEEAAASEDYGRGDGRTDLGVFSAQI